MSWKVHRNKIFYYRTERHGHKFRLYYIGGGAGGALSAAVDRYIADDRAGFVAAYKTLRKKVEELHQRTQAYDDLAELLTAAHGYAAGWRRLVQQTRPYRFCLSRIGALVSLDFHYVLELHDLVLLARHEDKPDAMRDYLNGGPILLQGFNELAAQVRDDWIVLAVGPDSDRQQAAVKQLRAQVDGLVDGATESPVRLVAERIGVAWLARWTCGKLLAESKAWFEGRATFMGVHERTADRRYWRLVGILKEMRKRATKRPTSL